jgi:predicted glycosyltransferase
LLDANHNEIDDKWRDGRKQLLLETFASFKPQVLITETFPFGRRMMRFELIPLLEAARANASRIQIIASVRDILQPKTKPGRNEEICELVDRFYDHVIVHGDQTISRLNESFALADRISDKISYSGYICASTRNIPSGHDAIDEVLVSAGGSATGIDILKTAIAAKPLSALDNFPWRILVSPSIDEANFNQLRQLAGAGISVERNRPDFSSLIRRARLSISQAGYNTVTDILNSETAAVIIPYAEAGEIEQSMRAQTLQRCGRLVMLPQHDLSAPSLAAAIAQADQQNTPLEVNLAGATNSANLISQWLNDSRRGN